MVHRELILVGEELHNDTVNKVLTVNRSLIVTSYFFLFKVTVSKSLSAWG